MFSEILIQSCQNKTLIAFMSNEHWYWVIETFIGFNLRHHTQMFKVIPKIIIEPWLFKVSKL